MKKKAVSIVLIVLDMILLVLFVFVLTGFLRSVIGADVIEYENWNGELDNPLVLRLGSGFWGLMIILVRFIVFTILQRKILKGTSMVMMVVAIVLHAVIGVLGLLYWIKWGDGPFFIYMIQLLFERIFVL
jgi:hypothetical protein